MNGLDIRAIFNRLGMLGSAALVAGVAALVIVCVMGWGVVQTMLSGGDVGAGTLRDPTSWAQRYATSVARHQERIVGRSPFFAPVEPPPPPKPPPPPPPKRDPVDPGPPPPPPKPRSYGGPDIIAMMGNVVWFEDETRVPVGEEYDDVTVLATNPPWSATLLWKEVEFDVELFERTTDEFVTFPEPEPSAASPDA